MKVEGSEELDMIMPFSVSRSIDATLISQVEDGIRLAIERGVFKSGSSLPTTREIAKSLGVGRVVVERALSRLKKRNYVSARPRAGIVVLDSGEKLWRGTVLIVSTSHAGSYYPNVVSNEIKTHLLNAGFFCLQVSAESFSNGAADLSALNVYLRGHVDFAVEIFNSSLVEKSLSRAGVPFIAVGNKTCRARHCCGNIALDWNLALPEFMKQCRAQGVRHVLQVSGGSFRKMADLSTVLTEAGIRCERCIVNASRKLPMPSNFERASYRVVRKFLRSCRAGKKSLPDLVFFSDDHLAAGGLWALADVGVDVPGAVKVVTWANRGDEPAYSKDLTMMVMDPRAHGHAIAKGVIEWLEKGRLSECPTLGPEYVFGQTFA